LKAKKASKMVQRAARRAARWFELLLSKVQVVFFLGHLTAFRSFRDLAKIDHNVLLSV
jgi:hypothetical protein